MNKMQEQVREFMNQFPNKKDKPLPNTPVEFVSEENAILALNLIHEEYKELEKALRVLSSLWK